MRSPPSFSTHNNAWLALIVDPLASSRSVSDQTSGIEKLHLRTFRSHKTGFSWLCVITLSSCVIQRGSILLRSRWSSAAICTPGPAGPTQDVAAAAGKAAGRDNGWTRSRVCWLRNHRGIAPYRESERTERGEVTLVEASEILKVSEATVRRLIADKVTAARYCKVPPG